jgi:glycosidase
MNWIHEAICYHIFPLGLCGAPYRNDLAGPPTPRIDSLYPWLDHIQGLGCNTILLGPVFESLSHGYDTIDLYTIDRRLGDRESFTAFTQAVKARGMRLVLDAVFNHVGRNFWAFRDVQQYGRESQYAHWFHQLNFTARSPYGDPFSYEGWAGHMSLVKLNHAEAGVREHLFGAVKFWIEAFGIDGLRLDAADVIDPGFLRALSHAARGLKSDFWLMGEVVHGNYTQWANFDMLDSTTNYECYKGLYSSLVDRNYFEIAYALNRQFGSGGLYQHLLLFNFVDNHDVNRVASNLDKPAHLYPLYGLLYTMPGVPSLYYGSEWGIAGARTPQNDKMLRPALDISRIGHTAPHPDLIFAIRRLAEVRAQLVALRYGQYIERFVASQQFVFERRTESQRVIVALNADDTCPHVTLRGVSGTRLRDVLNGNQNFPIQHESVTFDIHPNWLRIMIVE